MLPKDFALKSTASFLPPGHRDDLCIWAFDLGKGSIGEAVRIGTTFKHKASLLIPGDFAETRTARDRRRMWRTRQAHLAREHWLRDVFQAAGLPVLYGRNYDAKTGKWKPGELGDPRLEREFPPKGEAIYYTSCLLRIKLMGGEKLEPWQVFKAFRSAIQRLVGQQNDRIVRHRLDTFAKRLKALDAHGRPDHVVLEFVREDFMGKKAKIELSKFMRDRAEERKRAREEAAKAGATERSAGLKLELLRVQDGRCLYTDAGLAPSRLDEYEIEHIVPCSRGGPDAVFNYVLTTHEANEEKGGRTPYEWLSAADGWDAYVSRVRFRSLALRNKKVQLLISPNAEELAERYTALAETAWIAKLAQTIAGLHFGWRNGVDYSGAQAIKRVHVISGGLTGRIRRKYGLNRILNPTAQDEEEAEKKNRDDDRHHALDAMVISFIPGWARDAKKEGFFRFPEGVHRDFFAKEIADVIPRNLCYEKPALAETIYGARGIDAGRVIVQRVELFKLAMKGIAPGKTKYDLDYLRKQINSVRDGHIQRKLAEFAATSPGETQWKAFCGTFHITKRDGTPGSAVRRVLMRVGAPAEFKDLSKDGSGSWRKRKKDHRGQIVFSESGDEWRVLPVYVFESLPQKLAAIRKQYPKGRTFGFFQSGCLVSVSSKVAHRKKPLPPGTYKLRTIREDGYVQIEDQAGKTYPDWPLYGLSKLIAAGFERLY